MGVPPTHATRARWQLHGVVTCWGEGKPDKFRWDSRSAPSALWPDAFRCSRSFTIHGNGTTILSGKYSICMCETLNRNPIQKKKFCCYCYYFIIVIIASIFCYFFCYSWLQHGPPSGFHCTCTITTSTHHLHTSHPKFGWHCFNLAQLWRGLDWLRPTQRGSSKVPLELPSASKSGLY